MSEEKEKRDVNVTLEWILNEQTQVRNVHVGVLASIRSVLWAFWLLGVAWLIVWCDRGCG